MGFPSETSQLFSQVRENHSPAGCYDQADYGVEVVDEPEFIERYRQLIAHGETISRVGHVTLVGEVIVARRNPGIAPSISVEDELSSIIAVEDIIERKKKVDAHNDRNALGKAANVISTLLLRNKTYPSIVDRVRAELPIIIEDRTVKPPLVTVNRTSEDEFRRSNRNI